MNDQKNDIEGVDSAVNKILRHREIRILTRGRIAIIALGGIVVLLSGGNDGRAQGRRGTNGTVQVYVRRDGKDLTVPLDQFHPGIADPADRSLGEMSCTELAAAGLPQFAFLNLAVTNAMCSALLRLLMYPDEKTLYDEATFDILDAISVPHWLTWPDPQLHCADSSLS